MAPSSIVTNKIRRPIFESTLTDRLAQFRRFARNGFDRSAKAVRGGMGGAGRWGKRAAEKANGGWRKIRQKVQERWKFEPIPRPTWKELTARCQKPDHRRVGNAMARWIVRPAAQGITWLVIPTGISANMATLMAAVCATAAAGAWAWGTLAGWVVGAVLLQLWYLWDHVDGQLARFHGTASLDGVASDYLMHHYVQLITPLGIGFGLFVREFQFFWLFAGLAWGVGLLLLGLLEDVRAKAFLQRLKRVDGELRVVGGGAARPEPTPAVPWRDRRKWAGFLARKLCEPHVGMNLLTLVAGVQIYCGDVDLTLGRCFALGMAVTAPTVAGVSLRRGVLGKKAEADFAAWYTPPTGMELVERDGRWRSEKTRQVGLTRKAG